MGIALTKAGTWSKHEAMAASVCVCVCVCFVEGGGGAGQEQHVADVGFCKFQDEGIRFGLNDTVFPPVQMLMLS